MKNLITAADITTYTVASLNVEAHRLEVTIPEATNRYLRPLVGVVLLGQLLAFVATAPEPPMLTGLARPQADAALATYATDLSTWRTSHAGDKLLVLWDEVKRCLSQWALVEAWPGLLVHIDNAGVVLKVGKEQGTTSADNATLDRALNAHRATAIWRGDELVRWLESNKTDYPAYVSTQPLATNAQPLDMLGGIDLS